MCLGAQARAQNEAARRQYKYQNEKRERQWMQTLSIYDSKIIQSEINSQNALMAVRGAATDAQLQRQQARDDAQIKYQEMYVELLNKSDTAKLIASGQTGQSIRKMRTNEIAKYGRNVSEIGRQLVNNDYAINKELAKAKGQAKGYVDAQYAEVAFQPIPDVAPPQPVMQSVGAAAFMDALSIGSSIATMGGANGFGIWGP